MIIKGIDTVEFGVEILDYFISAKNTLDILSSLKGKAQEEGKEYEVNLNGLNLKVHRNGIPFYSFTLSCNDFLIYFMDKEVKNTCPIKVRFLSTYLWSVGFNTAVNEFLSWVKGLDFNVVTTKLSRIDICVDSDELFFEEIDLPRMITRARGKVKHYVNDQFYNGRDFSGFTIGRGDPMLARIYNKSLEIKKSQKNWFYDLWKEKQWNSSDVWRVEFQIRRKCLKEFNINSIEEFSKKENNIWSYLTSQWLTMKVPNKDKNQSRWSLDPRWNIIQKADLNQIYSPAIRQKIKVGNTDQLLDQIAGLLISVGTLNDHDNLDITAEIAKRWTEMKLINKNTNFNEEKIERSKRFISIK
ncbi:replication initiation factor [Metabacillus litoralis]|uniref:replication initiation factor n=1 Tax=Metabacillus litoralis TaxID=152268 RepID=UPI000EF5AC94|nr:replication initiation factor [Metabacillus litoralis]